MDNLVKSQIITLFKKYDYYLSELDTKQEISLLCLHKFKDVIDNILKDKKIDTHEYQSDRSEEEIPSDEVHEDEKENIDADVNENLKTIYRKITKLTHPDIIKNDYLNSLYIRSTLAFKRSDLLNIYRIAVVLDIDIDIDFSEDFVSKIQENINSTQKKISFIESSYHMRWYHSDKKGRIAIILEYLNKYLN